MSLASEFETWAVAQGVKIDGVGIQEFPGRGFGLLATRDLQVDETILSVPSSALHNISSVPKSITTALTKTNVDMSVNGILALSLLKSSPKTPWDAILPTRNSLLPCIPFTWPPTLQALLPHGAALLLQKQQSKITQDWRAVSTAFPETDYEEYIYNWFLVSTRTFYWTAPKSQTSSGTGGKGRGAKEKKKPLDHDDCITLAPFADLFNHTSHGTVGVTFSAAGYTLATIAPVVSGEEVSISYGNHSNDFLLAEYGFVIPGVGNEWDEVRLDDMLEGLFSEEKKAVLKERKYWGKWVLDREGPCYRTRVAVGLVRTGVGRWERMVDGGGESKEEDVQELLGRVLREYIEVVKGKIEAVEKATEGVESQKEMLSERWKQIAALIQKYLDRIDGNKN